MIEKNSCTKILFVFICLSVFISSSVWGASLNVGLDTPSDHANSKNRLVCVQADSVQILRNPLTGWVLYASMGVSASDFWKRYDQMYVPSLGKHIKVSDYAHTLYIRASWTDFNPQENVYGWDIDSNLKEYIEGAYQRKMRLAFRVVVDSRDKRSEFTPQFVKDAGAKGFMSKGKWSPYADDLIFQKYYAKFVNALGAKFNDPSIVEFIDGFGLGKWGEYHTMIYSTGDDAPKKDVFNWVTDIYSQAFDKVPVVINYHRWIGTGKDWVDDAHFDPDSEGMLENAIRKGYSLRHDAFGMTTYYGTWERKFAKKYRNICPIIMEGGWIVGSHSYWQDPRGYRKDSREDVRRGEFADSKEAYVNMMDFRFGEAESWFGDAFDLVNEFLLKGGYRLCPDRISLPTQVDGKLLPEITHSWNNWGWGYCPTNIPQWNQKYKVAFALLNPKTNEVQYTFVDRSTDLSKWIKGTPAEYIFHPDMSGVKRGTYVWAVGLVDVSNSNQIGLNMAAKDNMLASGWLKLLEVKVKK